MKILNSNSFFFISFLSELNVVRAVCWPRYIIFSHLLSFSHIRTHFRILIKSISAEFKEYVRYIYSTTSINLKCVCQSNRKYNLYCQSIFSRVTNNINRSFNGTYKNGAQMAYNLYCVGCDTIRVDILFISKKKRNQNSDRVLKANCPFT